MSQIFLIRHAHSTANDRGILAGQDDTVELSPRGAAQALSLCQRLATMDIDLIVTSPLLRCRQTLEPFLESVKRNVRYVEDPRFIEMNYGSWSGKKLRTLSTRILWHTIQSHPSQVIFPAGERFVEMAARSNSALLDYMMERKNVAIFSHGDVIKSLLVHQLGTHLDNLQKIVIDPASISTLDVRGKSISILGVNDTSHLAASPTTVDSPSQKPQSQKKKELRGFLLGGGAGTA